LQFHTAAAVLQVSGRKATKKRASKAVALQRPRARLSPMIDPIQAQTTALEPWGGSPAQGREPPLR
jgi:hypothetical protein